MFSFETAGGCSASSSSALKISDRICARTLPRTPRASSVCFNAAASQDWSSRRKKKERVVVAVGGGVRKRTRFDDAAEHFVGCVFGEAI